MSYQPASIIDVLLAYGSRGGALYAAYRQIENPLQLTNVLWQGPGGETLEAYRNPNDLGMLREEREAWTQIALRSSSLRPESVGPNAPWLSAPIEQRDAYDLAIRAREARESSAPPQYSGAQNSLYQSGGSRAPQYPPSPASGGPSSAFSESNLGGNLGGYNGASSRGQVQIPFDSRGPIVDASHFEAHQAPAEPTFMRSDSAPISQVTGNWPREAFQMSQTTILPQPGMGEISVFVCVEIEMPVLMGEVAQDFTRDFARDVALNFSRAARTIPMTRETRGWMHGTRMTLGARMVMGVGSRAATAGEMDHARDALATALAQRTLPYVQIRFAEAPEWAQGIALPD